jgi:hypothetical protein
MNNYYISDGLGAGSTLRGMLGLGLVDPKSGVSEADAEQSDALMHSAGRANVAEIPDGRQDALPDPPPLDVAEVK